MASEHPLFTALLSASLFCFVQFHVPLLTSGPKPEQESLSPWITVQGRERDMLTDMYKIEVGRAMVEP